MKPIILSTSPGVRWSAQLRLNALWTLGLSYGLGLFLMGRTTSARQIVLNLFCLIGCNLLSAIWNDYADQDIDALNERKTHWQTFPKSVVRILTWLSIGIILVTAVMDWYRLAFVIAALLCGYLYNGLKWSGRPFASLILYSLYYRLLPFILGVLTVQSTHLPLKVLIFLLGLFIVRFSTGAFKDIPDQIGDKAQGRTTFVLKYGVTTVLWLGVIGWITGAGIIAISFPGQSAALWLVLGLCFLGGLLFRLAGVYTKPNKKGLLYSPLARAFFSENIFLLVTLVLLIAHR